MSDQPAPRDYPQMITPVNHIEPVPRRIRGYLGGQMLFDTMSARYVWESPKYPQYYIPTADVDRSALVDEDQPQQSSRGTARRHSLQVGDITRPAAAKVYGADTLPELVDTVWFRWAALDAWFEEDEQVYVHPRNPYTRVDALRSTRSVRIELSGVLLADSESPVMVFETGLPTRYYIDPTDVSFGHLVPTSTVTSCPYKGTTGGYWSAQIPDPATGSDTVHKDLAWMYAFPTRQLLPISGLLAFYNERVDIFLEDRLLPRPKTHFFRE
jgi:uncharacterized protein (DUF427 family)